MKPAGDKAARLSEFCHDPPAISSVMRRALLCLLTGSLLALAGAAPAEETALTRPQAFARAAALASLGKRLFGDPLLSASGRMACAGCHDPARAFGPANARDVQLGGKAMRSPGLRAVPSLKYLQAVPQFTAHYYDSGDEGDPSVDNGPTGGLTWDGRVDRRRDQARVPLLSPFEMANDDPAALVARVAKSAYADEMRRLFGASIFDDPDKTIDAVGAALSAYQQDAATFYPYNSKYDAYLAGRAQLTAQEARGLKLFNDPSKGNCASCHISARANDGTPPQFTDYGLIALGIPRNHALPANADATFFDLGACGPLRTDLAGRAEYCGLFRTPSLRNVALRETFFHNGMVHSLRKAVEFYVERDTNPSKWYPRDADGHVDKFDDLPRQYRGNINTEPPFGGRPGEKPVLSAAEIDDVVAFLKTLNDGYATSPNISATSR
jgi:cytochrome c peroxidase